MFCKFDVVDKREDVNIIAKAKENPYLVGFLVLSPSRGCLVFFSFFRYSVVVFVVVNLWMQFNSREYYTTAFNRKTLSPFSAVVFTFLVQTCIFLVVTMHFCVCRECTLDYR